MCGPHVIMENVKKEPHPTPYCQLSVTIIWNACTLTRLFYFSHFRSCVCGLVNSCWVRTIKELLKGNLVIWSHQPPEFDIVNWLNSSNSDKRVSYTDRLDPFNFNFLTYLFHVTNFQFNFNKIVELQIYFQISLICHLTYPKMIKSFNWQSHHNEIFVQ